MEKLLSCKACGEAMAKGVNKCPHCGKDKRNFFMKHKIISTILILVVLGALGNAINGDKDTTIPTASTTNTASTDTKETVKEETKEEVKPTEVVVQTISISASDLCKAYEDNEVKADKTYKDVTASITGEVTEIGVMLGQTFVVLSSGEEFSFTGVQCFFDEESEIDKIAELSNGDTVTILGVIDGKSLNIGVNDCILQ